jgi:flagellar motor switch protein FliM
MTPVAFDFRKPPPGDLGRHAVGWLTGACRRAAAPWSKLLPFPVSLSVGNVEVIAAGVALAALPEDALAVPLTTADPNDGTALVIFRRPFLLALLGGLVGEVPTALPADREATELELSLVGYLVRELFLEPLERAWPTVAVPKFQAGGLATPRLAWGGDFADLSLFATLDATAPFGEHPVYFLVPRSGLGARLAAADARPEPPPVVAAPQIEALVREMAVELTVVLGSAELSMRELAALRAGDVVVLHQKVDQPLDGLLAGTRKFRVWPGVVGDRAAVVIDAPAERD